MSAAPMPHASSGACCATERLAAARDGKRIKEALERALALDPDLDDAYFGIGMYRYYADVAPTAAQASCGSCCCFPAATSAKGWRRCCAPEATGACSRVKPTTSCTSSICWYEQQTPRALELLRGLAEAASRRTRSS